MMVHTTVFVYFYKLDEEKMKEIMAELQEVREKEEI